MSDNSATPIDPIAPTEIPLTLEQPVPTEISNEAGQTLTDPLDVNKTILPTEPIVTSDPSPTDKLPANNLLGGFGEELLGDADSQSIASCIQVAVESQLNTSYSKFNVVSYRQQVVAGINYLIKIEVDNDFIHVEAFKPLDASQNGEGIILKSVETGKLVEDPLLPSTPVDTAPASEAETTIIALDINTAPATEAESAAISADPTPTTVQMEWETYNEHLAPPPPGWIDDIPIIPPQTDIPQSSVESANATFLPEQSDKASNLTTNLMTNIVFDENNCPCENYCSEFSSEDCISNCRERMCNIPKDLATASTWWTLAIEWTLLSIGIAAIVLGLRCFKGRRVVGDLSYIEFSKLNK